MIFKTCPDCFRPFEAKSKMQERCLRCVNKRNNLRVAAYNKRKPKKRKIKVEPETETKFNTATIRLRNGVEILKHHILTMTMQGRDRVVHQSSRNDKEDL